MQEWLFIGPTLLAGIGQVTKKYAQLMGAEYISFGERPSKTRYDNIFMFVLPIDEQLHMIKVYYKNLTRNLIVMTVCETLTVHPSYEKILDVSTVVYCPSTFAQGVLQKQFPRGDFRLLHHWTPIPRPAVPLVSTRPYIFYTIGNIMDPRKNIQDLVYTFIRMKTVLGCDIELVLKATCRQSVDWKVPGIRIINGLLSDEEMDEVHDQCHCYINCSHSEGVGMGAVEAAMRDKPVIITDFGGLKEYVQTPFVVETTPAPIGFDDFLYTSTLEWGSVNNESLAAQMMTCYRQNVTHWDHSFTRDIVSSVRDHMYQLGKPPTQQTESH